MQVVQKLGQEIQNIWQQRGQVHPAPRSVITAGDRLKAPGCLNSLKDDNT